MAGADLINPGVQYWNYATGAFSSSPSPAWTNSDGSTALAQLAEFGRFCSGFLTTPLQLVSKTSLRGYFGQLYLANEETGDEGRVFAVTTSGDAVQLPRLGLFSWENTIAAPTFGDATVVMGNEDSAAGQMWIYIGTKRYAGTPVEKAGLHNGKLTVIDVVNQAVATDAQFRSTYGKNNPVPVTLNEIDWTQGGAAQNAEALAKGLTLNRIEDGSFDPRHPDDYYFVTTEGGAGATVSIDPVTGAGDGRDGGGLWRLRFVDVDRPALGATLELLLDRSEAIGLNKPDNMTIDGRGDLLVQEDPGNNVSVARIVAYRISDGAIGTVAQFDPARFGRDAAIANTSEFLTQDEESSGIVPPEPSSAPARSCSTRRYTRPRTCRQEPVRARSRSTWRTGSCCFSEWPAGPRCTDRATSRILPPCGGRTCARGPSARTAAFAWRGNEGGWGLASRRSQVDAKTAPGSSLRISASTASMPMPMPVSVCTAGASSTPSRPSRMCSVPM